MNSTDTNPLAPLLDATVRAWAAYLKANKAAVGIQSTTLKGDVTFLAGRYHGLRDAYKLVGGAWSVLSSALDAAEGVS